MNITRISASDLKRNTAEVLNSVVYGGVVAVVERHGEPLVKMIPVAVNKKNRELTIKDRLKRTFGSMPDFPDVTSYRYFRKRDTRL